MTYQYPPSDIDGEIIAIAHSWECNSDQVVTLLHNNTMKRTALVHQINILVINSALPTNWMTIPNVNFYNNTPVYHVKEQGVDGLSSIRLYLERLTVSSIGN